MNFTREGHWHRFTNEKERLNIHWDMILACNYKCSYCYARNFDYYQCSWEKDHPSLDLQLTIVDAVSRSTLPYNFGLLGGEPTLNKWFKVLWEHINKKCSNGENRIYLVTNGSKSKEWFEEMECHSRNGILWSFHPEYAEIKEFMEKVLVMKDKGYDTKVNLMLHPDNTYWDKIKTVWEICNDTDTEIHPHFMYKEGHDSIWPYTKEFWEWAKIFSDEPRKYQFTNDDNTYRTFCNDYEVFTEGINVFKGWKCYNSNHKIDVEGNVRVFCNRNDEGTNLTKDRNYFKNIKKLEPVICEFDRCFCDGLLKIYKEK